LLEHLKLWREWNQAAGNPFQGKVDLARIALMGHSRGGEAAATAALFNRLHYYPENANIRFDYGFAIQAVVAIAPADGQYKPAGQSRWIEDVSYLTLQGAQDADVSSFMGSRQWEHVRYTQPGSPWFKAERFKAEIYAYRANHGQFNTVWGRTDAGEPLSWFLNLKPLLAPEAQRRIAKTYIAAFLEATLKDRREYLPLFEDWRVGRAWLPDTLYVNRYPGRVVRAAGFLRGRCRPHHDYRAGRAYSGRQSIDLARGPHSVAAGRSRLQRRLSRMEPRQRRAHGRSYTITLPEGAAVKWRLGKASTIELSAGGAG
jgi:dienelactone hydrolase